MELNLHWSLMEKLPKLERGGENRRGTSPMMGKNDSEARKLRELSYEEIGLDFCFTGVREELRKTVYYILFGEDGGRHGGGESSSPLPWLGPGRPVPAPWATAAAKQGGRLWFAGENNEGGRERNDRGPR
jgi:hypothetical protein